jgi:hypothetical protein
METSPVPMTAVEMRQAEVTQYENNIAIYTQILATLPTEYPAHLEQYKGAINQHEVIAEVEDLDDVELLAKLWYADQCKKMIRSEMVEKTKAQAILNQLLTN